MKNYENLKCIGNGSFGQVFLVKDKSTSKEYVIKKINTRDISEKDQKNIENEVNLMKQMRHPNIVGYRNSFIEDDYINIVMTYCEGGDMYNKIKANGGKHFSENIVYEWFAQLAFSLHYLHDQKILHRDLKTQNIFIKGKRLIYGDFGIAKSLDSTMDFASTCIGTPYYMSPEMYKYKPYSYKSDIWALGCVLYEICNLKHAFTAQSLNGLAVKIIKGNYLPITTKYSKPLRDLIMSMLNINPKKRPTIEDILKKPIIKKKLVSYVISLYKNHAKEDDIFLDTVKSQCARIGIDTLVEKYMNRSMPPNVDFNQEQSDKLKERRRVKEIELKKQLKKKDDLERKIKEIETKIKSKNLDPKEKVLYDKEMRKLEEIKKREDELEKIRNENEIERSKAKEKFKSQYQESKHIKEIMNDGAIGNTYNDEFEEQNYDENDFADMNKIEEVDEEQELDDQLESYKKRLHDNTVNIKKIKEDLKETTKKLNYDLTATDNQYDDIDAISQETPFNISDLEDTDGEFSDESDSMGGLGKMFGTKIKDLEMRVMSGTGEIVYRKAYDFLKENKGRSCEDLRPYLTEILGNSLIGYWHLIEQILFYQSFLEQAKGIED